MQHFFSLKYFSMNKHTVFLCEEIEAQALSLLKQHCTIVDNFDHSEDIEGIITRKIPVTAEIMAKCPNLKVISDHGTGTDQIDLIEAKKRGVKVKNTPGENAQSVAELALSFMLSLLYKVKLNDKGLEQGRFSKWGLSELNGNELFGKKVGIIGSGYTAKRLSLILKTAFNCKVFSYNPHKTKEELSSMGFYKIDTLEKMFSEMDIVSVNVPLTAETKDMINKKIFDVANPHLLLVNTSRGGIVNEADLFDSLAKGKIAGAASDVFTQEPPSKENPLLSLDNFIATLHVAGSTEESLRRVGVKTVENLLDILL